MNKLIGPLIGLALVGLIAFFALTDSSTEDLNQYFKGELTDIQETDNKSGAGNKNVSIIEYGDFQCPFCAQIYPTVNEAKSKYGDDITLAFRHFPLTNIHPNAMAAHRASEAAGLQGKFFEMHDLLYENQAEWSGAANITSALEVIESYATEINLDIDKYKVDIESEEVRLKIQAQQDSGSNLGVTGTPTLFVNGERIDIPANIDELSAIIDNAIAGKPLDSVETTGESTDSAGITGGDETEGEETGEDGTEADENAPTEDS